MPGAGSVLFHVEIRTAHAARALGEQQTPQRLNELAYALGYWAARYGGGAVCPARTLQFPRTWKPSCRRE